MIFLLPKNYIARQAHYRHPLLLPSTGFIPRQSWILVNYPKREHGCAAVYGARTLKSLITTEPETLLIVLAGVFH
jgi:hypothetical protein